MPKLPQLRGLAYDQLKHLDLRSGSHAEHQVEIHELARLGL